MRWIWLLVSPGLLSSGAHPAVSAPRAALIPEGCEEVGAPANAHSCGHAERGPFEAVTASPLTASFFPGINAPHTQYTITLPDDGAGDFLGAVIYRPTESGSYSFYLSRPVPLRLIDEDAGIEAPLALGHSIDECPGALDRAQVYELVDGVRYRVEIGPDPGEQVAVVVENLDALSVFYYADGDRDGHGDLLDEQPFLTWCAPPEGRVGTADDCDDEEPTVNPVADEVCNRIDDDCDGTTDHASGLVCDDAGPSRDAGTPAGDDAGAARSDAGPGGAPADEGGCGVAGFSARSAWWTCFPSVALLALCLARRARRPSRRPRRTPWVLLLAALAASLACGDDSSGARMDAAPLVDAGPLPDVDAAHGPELTDDRARTTRDVRVHIDVLANDGDSGSLALIEVATPENGAATAGPGGVITYAPAAGWSGEETFVYRARSDSGVESTATVTVSVSSSFGTVVGGVLHEAVAELPEGSASGLRWLGINDAGDLVGALDDQAVRWPAGGERGLIALEGALLSFAYSINDAGDIVGELNDGVDAFGFEIIGGVTSIAPRPVLIPQGVADDGTVVGFDAGSDPPSGWFRLPGELPTTVAREGVPTALRGVNANRTMVGDDFGIEGSRCFIRDPSGPITPLAPLEGAPAQAIHGCTGINDAGIVVGSAGMVVGDTLPFVAVRWTDGVPKRVHFPFPPESGATYRAELLADVNNVGAMAGWYYEEVPTRDPPGRFVGVLLAPLEPTPGTFFDDETPYDHVPGF